MIIEIRDAIRDALAEEMRRDKNTILMGEEVAAYEGAYKVTRGLLQEFGDKRVIDTPISEYGFAGIGVGMAFAGLSPIVEFMTFNFAMQAIDHIVNSAAKTLYMSGGHIHCPIVFRGPNGPALGVGAQHSQCYASWYSHIPGLTVISPYSAEDHKSLLKAAIRYKGPVVFLENEILYGRQHEIPDNTEDYVEKIGVGKILQEGKDITIVSFSIGVEMAIKAAAKLKEINGVSAEVIDLRTLRPIDKNILVKSFKKTNRMVVAEGGWESCGIGAEISSIIMEEAFDYLDAPVLRASASACPLPYAKNLENLAILSDDKIYQKALQVLNIEQS